MIYRINRLNIQRRSALHPGCTGSSGPPCHPQSASDPQKDKTMNSMKLAFNAVFPLLAFMMTGYFLRKKSLLDKPTAAGMNKLVFRVFLPLNIFQSIYNADIRGAFDLKVSLFVALTCIASFITISAIIKRKETDPAIVPVMIQGIHKANYNLLALPIVSSFFGNDLGMAAVLVMIVTPIVNTCSTITFEQARGGSSDPIKMIKKVLLNPLVLSSLIGLAVNMSELRIPAMLMNSVVSKPAAMATPLAMLALGSDFDFARMKVWAKRLVMICTGKLLILPLILVTAAVLIGIRGADLIAVLIYSGGPTAVNSYSTAVSMGGNGELAGAAVAISSFLSVFTLFVFLTVLGSMGML